MIPFEREMFPFYLADKNALGVYLGVTERTIRIWLNDTMAPDNPEVLEKMVRIRKFDLFPLDAAPEKEKEASVKFADVIGRVAHAAYRALLAGNEEIAEAISSKALNARSPAWNPDQSSRKDDLSNLYLQMVNAIAWTRNTNLPESRDGLHALSRLRRRVEICIARQRKSGWDVEAKDDGRAWAAWQFLWATCSAYWLCDLLGEVEQCANPQDRQALALRVCKEHGPGFMHQRKKYSSRTNIAAMNAWNLAQLAGVSGSNNELFGACLETLRVRYSKDFDLICSLLESDRDTGPFLRRSGSL